MKVLVTGMAGFIGYHVALKLSKDGHNVYGIDNINDYYDPHLKYDRLNDLGINREAASVESNECHSNKFENLKFKKVDLTNDIEINNLFDLEKFDKVCHLAAQAGVRYSFENPKAYINSNILGFNNILECCKNYEVEHLVYASSSSVYGNNKKTPFGEQDVVDSPISLYASTKISNELMAHTYNHLYGLTTTGLRLFTVYGPWGRPDMATFLFTDAILTRTPLNVFNNGKLERDFTYIDDVVEGIVRLLCSLPTSPTISLKDYSSGNAASRIVNIGNSNPVSLMDFVSNLENILGIKADIEFSAFQAGDVKSTFADMRKFKSLTGFEFQTPLLKGLKEFVDWYKDYYKKK